MSAWIAAVLSTGLVSVTPSGNSGDADSGFVGTCIVDCYEIVPSGRTISANGRLVVFQSAADDLVAGDTNGSPDVFLRDLDLGATRRLSVDPAGREVHGSSLAPSISPGGRYVAFVSNAPDIVLGTPTGSWQVYVRDLSSGTTVLVSEDSNGNPADLGAGILSWHAGGPATFLSGAVSVSDGGRVAFLSRATNLVPNDLNGCADVFVHDLATRTTVRASVDSNGNGGNGWSGGRYQHNQGPSYTGLSLSGDGRFVAFASEATNLDGQDWNFGSDVFVHDLVGGTTRCVSVNDFGRQGQGDSRMPSISYDGRYIAFESFAGDLVPGDTNGRPDVFFVATSSGAGSSA